MVVVSSNTDRKMSQDKPDSFKARRQKQENELRSLEKRLEKLRVDFDQFFMGIIKVPPVDARDKLRRDLRFSDLKKANNTALRFRFQNLTQKFTTYTTYWERTMRQRADGSFRKGPRQKRK